MTVESLAGEVGGDGGCGREGGEFGREPRLDFVEGLGDAAVELHAGPAKARGGYAGGFEFVAHEIVGDFFATVLKQECGGHVGVRDVAAVGAVQ